MYNYLSDVIYKCKTKLFFTKDNHLLIIQVVAFKQK